MFDDKSLILIGMPGAGKTTLGKRLAERFDVQFNDSDAAIERSIGRPIFDIIEEMGEAFFRHKEAMACSTLLQHSRGVIALGGGAILAPETRMLLKSHRVVYLHATPLTLAERLKADTTRPLLNTSNKLNALEQLLDTREAHYRACADCVIETDGLSTASVLSFLLNESALAEELACHA